MLNWMNISVWEFKHLKRGIKMSKYITKKEQNRIEVIESSIGSEKEIEEKEKQREEQSLADIEDAYGGEEDEIETYTPEKLNKIIHNAEWRNVPTGIEIKTGIIPKFIISAEYDIEQFFHTLNLNAYNLSSDKGEFDVRVTGFIYFIPDNYKSIFVNKQKEFDVL